jgi:hypothetical protein
MVADWSGSLLEWEEEFGRLKARIARVFSRIEFRRAGGALIDDTESAGGLSRIRGDKSKECPDFSRHGVS